MQEVTMAELSFDRCDIGKRFDDLWGSWRTVGIEVSSQQDDAQTCSMKITVRIPINGNETMEELQRRGQEMVAKRAVEMAEFILAHDHR
jgi:hypothetical protein